MTPDETAATVQVTLTQREHAAVVEALEQYRAFAIYGEGRAEHQAFVNDVLRKVKP